MGRFIGFAYSMESMYNKKQLAIGTKIEMEHATPTSSPEYNKRRAIRIAKQHLKEYKSYYIVLPVAEKRMAAIDRAMKKKK